MNDRLVRLLAVASLDPTDKDALRSLSIELGRLGFSPMIQAADEGKKPESQVLVNIENVLFDTSSLDALIDASFARYRKVYRID